VCPQIFTVLAIKCDGSVSPCSVDWDNDRALGNIHDETLFRMWNGQALRELRLGHLENGRKKFAGCSSCGLPKYSCTDDLEPYADELAKKIREEQIDE
jgi:radical SAM protein with 4Fe4S-binding SPASM domain